MKTIKHKNELPEWFNLKKYDRLKYLSLTQMKEELEFRRELVSFVSESTSENGFLKRGHESSRNLSEYFLEKLAYCPVQSISDYDDIKFETDKTLFEKDPTSVPNWLALEDYGDNFAKLRGHQEKLGLRFETKEICEPIGNISVYTLTRLADAIEHAKPEFISEFLSNFDNKFEKDDIGQNLEDASVTSWITYESQFHEPEYDDVFFGLLDRTGLNNRTGILAVDFDYPDQVLIEKFKEYLCKERTKIQSKPSTLSFTLNKISKIITYRVLPYIDIRAWAESNDVKIHTALLEKIIFPEGIYTVEQSNKLSKQVLTKSFIHSLP
jgi:hypothetical protein